MTMTILAPCHSSPSSSIQSTQLINLKALQKDSSRSPCHETINETKLETSVPRLLYRGALSLPDSHLLLDGITFTIQLPIDDRQASIKFLENPLPLALESMRGRPSLRFVGVVRMDDICCDFSGGVTAHIHPRSILTHQLFTHNLCATPVTSPSGHTDYGIRIRIGDSDNTSSSSDVVVYGRPHPSSSTMQLCVARIMLSQPQSAVLPKAVAKLRPPRPDDPTPRIPPLMFGKLGVGIKRPLDKGKGKEGDEDGGVRKKSKKEDVALPNSKIKDLGKNARAGKGFKLPALPVPLGRAAVRRDEGDVYLDSTTPKEHISELEAANKLIVKQATVRLLAAAGIAKHHPEFKDLFGYVYRGTGFALRGKMKAIPLNDASELIDRIINAHIKLYSNGEGIGIV